MALAHRADWLISKDKHLLTLKNRAAKQNLRIGTIDDWRRSIK
jgi:predicted nucleic acid-binding protein